MNIPKVIYRIDTVCPVRKKVIMLRWNPTPESSRSDGYSNYVRSVPFTYVNGSYKHFPTPERNNFGVI